MKKPIPLAERLKRQAATENGIIQAQMKEQLAALQSGLHDIMQRELNTIRADIERQSRNLGWRTLKNRLLWPFLIGLSLSAGLLGGSWGMMIYLSNRIETMERTVAVLRSQGGRIRLNTCDNRLCARTDEKAPAYQDGYRILKED